MLLEEIFYRHYALAQQENRIYANWCRRRGLSYSWVMILDQILRASNGIEPAMLSDNLSIPRQTITSLLDQLEKNELMTRKRSTVDRRRIKLSLTKKGKDLVEGIMKELAIEESAIVEEITSEDMATLNRIYSDIVKKLQTRLIDAR